MNPVQNWGEAVTFSLLQLWDRFIVFLPSFLGALIVILFGIIAAVALGKTAEKIIRVLRVDQAVEKMKLGERFKMAGFQISVSRFFGELVKWFLVLVFLMAATDILGLSQVTAFLDRIILYIPNIVVATIILSIAFLVGNFAHHVVRESTKVAGIMSASLLAIISKWSIIVFGFLAAFIQLGIAASLINTIFTGIVAALALALGLSFGLGGKDEAALILRKIRESVTDEK